MTPYSVLDTVKLYPGRDSAMSEKSGRDAVREEVKPLLCHVAIRFYYSPSMVPERSFMKLSEVEMKRYSRQMLMKG